MVNFFKKIFFLFDNIFPRILVDFRIKVFRKARGIWDKRSSVETIDFHSDGKHVFFGYYDITPFSGDGKMILAVKTPDIRRTPSADDYAEIGFFAINDSKSSFNPVGLTNTWCWQQGCRLQWYGEGNKQIIYNCLVGGEYGSMIKEICSGKAVKEIKKPLYSISKDGKWGLSLDFSRLQRLRPGYGYSVLKDESQGELIPERGIDLVDIESGEWRQLFSLPDIVKIEPHKSMDGAEHYFNHLMFNPSGTKFLFFHLWLEKSGKRHSRLFVSDLEGRNIKLLNNSGSVSHYNWKSDNEIILYSFLDEKKKYAYAIFNSLDGRIEYFEKYVPDIDGHPNFFKDGNIFITDTYPDLCFQRNLISCDLKNKKMKVLARFNDFKDFTGEFRCDLHPRISNDEKMICVDRIINKRRNLSIIPVDTSKL